MRVLERRMEKLEARRKPPCENTVLTLDPHAWSQEAIRAAAEAWHKRNPSSKAALLVVPGQYQTPEEWEAVTRPEQAALMADEGVNG